MGAGQEGGWADAHIPPLVVEGMRGERGRGPPRRGGVGGDAAQRRPVGR